MNKSAILLGATGLTGGILLNLLLDDERYNSIKIFGRRPTNNQHPKIKECIVDLFNPTDFSDEFNGDVVFCCIGTTKAKTKDKNAYRETDKGIPVKAAILAKKNDIKTFIVISALGADAKSRIFYNRVKGEMEQEVLQQQITNTYILQPSLIEGNRNEKRLGEQIASFAMNLLSPIMLGGLHKYKPIEAETIAKCMVWLDNNNYQDIRIPSDKIKDLVNKR